MMMARLNSPYLACVAVLVVGTVERTRGEIGNPSQVSTVVSLEEGTSKMLTR